MSPEDILHFWFEEIDSKKQFIKDTAFDDLLRRRFGAVHKQAIAGELSHWRTSWQGRLAEIIVIDQFSRNLFRDSGEAFAYDGMALTLAQEAVLHGSDAHVPDHMIAFLYMPYMHSESALVHEEAVKLFALRDAMANNLDYEYKHKAIIDRFGCYPHRNEALGRESTPEELAFVEEHGGF